MNDKTVGRLLALNLVLGLAFGGVLIHDLARPSQPQYIASGDQTAVAGEQTGIDTAAGDSAAGVDTAAGGTAGDAASRGSTSSGQSKSVTAPKSGPALKAGAIVFGGIYTMTGPVDSRPEANIVKAVFQEVNASGGVHGRMLQLQARDDGWDPTRAMAEAHELVEQEKVFAFVGNLAPNSESAFLPYLEKVGIPVVGGLGVPEQEDKPNMFLTLTAWRKAARMGGAPTKYIGCKKSVIWIVDLPFTKPSGDILYDSMTKANCQPVARPEIINSAQPDYTNYVIKARAQGAESVIMGLDPGGIMRAVNAMASQNWKADIVLAAPSNTLIEGNLGNKIEGAFMTSIFLNPQAHPNYPGVQRYLALQRKYYPDDFSDPYVQQSYVAAWLTVEALKKAGPDPTWKSFVAAMNQIKNFDTGLSLPLSYSPAKHDPLDCMEVLTRKGGKWVPVIPRWLCQDGSEPPLPSD